MTKFIALHRTIGDPKAGWEAFGKLAPQLAADIAAGKTAAKLLKTWNPYAYGRNDYIFCLWEAEKFIDVEQVLRDYGFYQMVSTDVIPVAEIDWAELVNAS